LPYSDGHPGEAAAPNLCWLPIIFAPKKKALFALIVVDSVTPWPT